MTDYLDRLSFLYHPITYRIYIITFFAVVKKNTLLNLQFRI